MSITPIQHALMQAHQDAQNSNLNAQESLWQAIDKMQNAFVRVLEENTKLHEKIAFLESSIATKDRVYQDTMKGLSEELSALRIVSDDHAKQILNNDRKQTKNLEDVHVEIKEAFNGHNHSYYSAMGIYVDCHKRGTDGPNKQLK